MTIWIPLTLTILIFSFTFVNCNKTEFATCFPHFGCINFTSIWFDHHLRPENLEPLERHIVNTKFLLLTTAPEPNSIGYDLITPNAAEINITLYEKHYALMLLIHDFTCNGYTGWIKHMTLQLAQLEHYNIIAVDWQEGAEPPFLQAISNARVVAIEIQMLLSLLHQEFELVLSEIHMIGHGVGAHIAAYVGKHFKGKIGRITGLDPTGPCFENMPPDVRLNFDDAIYVEVIHTDGDGNHHQGTMQPLGNMDFYFNNGSFQPGCRTLNETMGLLDVRRDKLKEGAVLVDCSHKRAFHYYLAAMKEKTCAFLALPWTMTNNEPVECTKPSSDLVMCASVGLDVDTKSYAGQTNSKYRVDTARCQPYCRNRYQIQIDFAKCSEADNEIIGFFNIILRDEEGRLTNLTFNHDANDSQVIQQGERLTFTAWTSDVAVNEATHMNITWHFSTPFCFFCKNDTCVERMAITHVRPHVSAIDATVTNHFCTGSPGCRYTVLYDHRPSTELVKCPAKKKS